MKASPASTAAKVGSVSEELTAVEPTVVSLLLETKRGRLLSGGEMRRASEVGGAMLQV